MKEIVGKAVFSITSHVVGELRMTRRDGWHMKDFGLVIGTWAMVASTTLTSLRLNMTANGVTECDGEREFSMIGLVV